jgi:hypothetical protein
MEKHDLFIDSLKRDKASGNTAPHQIILLISFLNLSDSLDNNQYKIQELALEFDANWVKYSHLYLTKNKNIGMPIKAMINKGLIEIKILESILNYRNKKEIFSKIENLRLSNELKVFLNTINIKYLEQRIII